MLLQRFLKLSSYAALGLFVLCAACDNSPTRSTTKGTGGSGGSAGATGGVGGGTAGMVGGMAGAAGQSGGAGGKGTGGSTGPITIAQFQGDLNGFEANTGWEGGDVGTNLAWMNYAGTPATVTLAKDVGNPPGSMKYEMPFTNYKQFMNCETGFQEGDWTDKTIYFDVKTGGPLPPSLKDNGGISFQIKDSAGNWYYGFWKPLKSEPNLDDGNWHTLKFNVPATFDKFDQTRVLALLLQVGSGGIPASLLIDGGAATGADGGATGSADGGGAEDGGGSADGGGGADSSAPVVMPGFGTAIFYFDNIIVK